MTNRRFHFTKHAMAGLGVFLISVCVADANLISYHTTVYDTDYASAGVSGVRGGDGNANITLSGVSGTVKKAVLYWHGPAYSTSPGVIQNVKFDNNNITGVNIGTASGNCWQWPYSHAYRADVTAFVSGNGTYSVSDLIKLNQADINGASLQVFYDDGNSLNNRDIVVFDGNDSNIATAFDIAGWQVALNGINYGTGSASIEMVVGDGQDWIDDAVRLNGTTLLAADAIGGPFRGRSLPDDGTANNTFGGLYDIVTADITSWLTPNSINNLNLTSGTVGDCLSLLVTSINLPAGAAPPDPNLPDGGCTVMMLGIGLAALAGGRKLKVR